MLCIVALSFLCRHSALTESLCCAVQRLLGAFTCSECIMLVWSAGPSHMVPLGESFARSSDLVAEQPCEPTAVLPCVYPPSFVVSSRDTSLVFGPALILLPRVDASARQWTGSGFPSGIIR